jgi:hypothetical protein
MTISDKDIPRASCYALFHACFENKTLSVALFRCALTTLSLIDP